MNTGSEDALAQQDLRDVNPGRLVFETEGEGAGFRTG